MKMTVPMMAVAGMLTVAGCQSTDPPAARTEHISAAAYPPVTATGGLERVLAHDRAVIERSEAGAMTVSVPVRILRDKEIPVEYRFLFLDDRGRPLRPEGDWQYKVLPARTQQFLTGTALDQDVADWRLEIRPAR